MVEIQFFIQRSLRIFFFFFFFFLATQFGMGDLSSPTRDRTYAPAVEVQSLNHWIPSEVTPHTLFFFLYS